MSSNAPKALSHIFALLLAVFGALVHQFLKFFKWNMNGVASLLSTISYWGPWKWPWLILVRTYGMLRIFRRRLRDGPDNLQFCRKQKVVDEEIFHGVYCDMNMLSMFQNDQNEATLMLSRLSSKRDPNPNSAKTINTASHFPVNAVSDSMT